MCSTTWSTGSAGGRPTSITRRNGSTTCAINCAGSSGGIERIRYALTTLYIAFTTFVGTSLVLAVDALLKNRLIALPIILAVAGVGLLLFASINLALEALEALRTNRLEIRFYRELYDRRLADTRNTAPNGSDGTGRKPELPAMSSRAS